MLENGRPSFLTPCASHISLKEKAKHGGESNQHFRPNTATKVHKSSNDIGHTVLERTKDDNKCAFSFEDQAFLKITEKDFHKDEANFWVAPLPFKSP